MKLRAPFPWFGGKSRAAHLVWPRLGDVANYIEPFAGSLAVLLGRPEDFPPRVETVNDKDCYLANFWRALQAEPQTVAKYADCPVNEADMHARHQWLVETARDRVEVVMRDPDAYDAKVAGYWVYGQCLWIGSGWCASDRRRRNEYPPGQKKRPHCDRGSGRGVHADLRQHANGTDLDKVVDWDPRPDLTSANGRGGVMLAQKRPYLGGNGGGVGVHKTRVFDPPRKLEMKRGGGRGVHRRPNMGGMGGGQGVHAPRLKQQIPQLSGDGSGAQRGYLAEGIARSGGLLAYMEALAWRLRRVRVCCGDWTRVLTPAVTTYIGLTGIFLDPPYQQDLRELCYAHDDDISHEVRAWAIDHGEDPKLRIVLCGYEGEHTMPAGWTQASWIAGGGYGRTARGKGNRRKERLWFSPHCLKDNRLPLFTETEASA